MESVTYDVGEAGEAADIKTSQIVINDDEKDQIIKNLKQTIQEQEEKIEDLMDEN